jgi:hypothetical protein
MFVRLNAEMQFTTSEMHAEEAGCVYAELGQEMGVMPNASGINSGRRNAAVQLSQGLDRAGMGQMLVKKLMQHRTSQGTTCFEAQYDDSPRAMDVGALMMDRRPEQMEALKSLLTTALPELTKLLSFPDIPKDDPIYMERYAEHKERMACTVVVNAAEGLVKAPAARCGETEGAEAELLKARTALNEARAVRNRVQVRLKYQVVQVKRWSVWESSAARFDELTADELRERACCCGGFL